MTGNATPDQTKTDGRRDRSVMLISTAVVGLLFACATTMQSVIALGVFSSTIRGIESTPPVELAVRGGINLVTVGVVLGLVAALRPESRGRAAKAMLSVLIIIVAGVARAAGQLTVGIYTLADTALWLTEIFTTIIATMVTLLISFALVGSTRRLRFAERRRAESLLETAMIYRELQDEELRVRREVAQGIHGTVQNVFVMLEAELADLATRVSGPEAGRLQRAATTVKTLREQEIRTLSSVLYPVDLDAGLDAALTALVVRLPAHVAVDSSFHVLARELDDDAGRLDFPTRLLLVRIVEEGLNNALGHGEAHSIRVSLVPGDSADTIVARVEDDGIGAPADAAWSGLARLKRHLEMIGGSMSLDARAATSGAVLTAVVPISASAAARTAQFTPLPRC